MGFLNLFRKKKEPEAREPEQPSEEREINLKELEDFCRQKLAGRLQGSEKKARDFQARILALFNSIPLNLLESAVFESGDKRYAAVNMSKDSYVTRIKTLLSSLPPAGEGYQGFLDFRKQAGSILSEMKNTTPKQMMALSNYFKKESRAVIEKIKEIDSELESFKSFMLSGGKDIKFAHTLGSENKIIFELLEKQKALQKSSQGIAKQSASVSEAKKEKEQQLQKLISSSEWNEMEALSEEIEKLESQAFALKSRIQGELAPLKRPLKKAKHILGSRSLDSFISSPFKELMSENGEKRLQEILGTMTGLIDDGKLTLKEKEKQKLLGLRAGLEGLESQKEKHKSLVLMMQEKRKKKESSALPLERNRLEEKAESLGAELVSLKSQAEKSKKSLETLEKEVSLKKASLEELVLKGTGNRIKITI